MKWSMIALVSVIAAILLAAGAAQALAGVTDFEGFTTGVSVNGQGGWTVEDQWGYDMYEGGWGPNLDEQIVNDGPGNKVWRISNAYAYNAYSSQPFSPTAPLVAGETGSSLWNDYGPDHTHPYSPPHPGATAETAWLYGAFDFRSATGGAQSGLTLTVSPSAKQSTVRMSYLKLSDPGSGGFDVIFYETGPVSNPWAPNTVTVASGLAYDEWHTVEMLIQLMDGLQTVGGEQYGNDVVKVYVDGNLVHTGSTWESYYAGTPEGPRLQAVDSMLFRVAAAQDNTLGNGFYFDNVEVSNVPEPATMVLLALGGIGTLLRRRRNK